MSSSIVPGINAVTAVLTHSPERVERLLLLQDRRDERVQVLRQLAEAAAVPCELVVRDVLDDLTKQHQGVVAVCHPLKPWHENQLYELLDRLEQPPLLLILDTVQDPHNLGACLRTANAAGVNAVVIPKDKSVGLTDTVLKVASGAAEVTPVVQVTNLARCMRQLKDRGIWLYGAAGEAPQALYQLDQTIAMAWVLGAEGTGLRRLTRDTCDVLAKIPMHGTVGSLNVSVATSVCLFEAVRQRLS